MGCHLAGACPYEVLDISPWAEATFRHFLHHPYAQRLPRKFKINFSGCATDCGQAMFNDVGVVAVARPLPDGTVEPGFRVFMAGGLGANPHPAQALEEFTAREDLLPDHRGHPADLRPLRQPGQQAAGPPQVGRRPARHRRAAPAGAPGAPVAAWPRRRWPGGIPAIVEELGDAPAGVATGIEPTPVGIPVTFRVDRQPDPYTALGVGQRGRRRGQGHRLGHRLRPLGRHHRPTSSGPWPPSCGTSASTCGSPTARTWPSGVCRPSSSPSSTHRLDDIGMAEPGAELARDVVACPGADTCNLAVTQSRGLADDIGRALEEAGLAEVGGVRINISGCTNSCGQHHIADIGFFGAERRAHGRPAPGYQMLLGGHVGDTEIEFGHQALRLPAKAAAEATVRLVGRFADEREAGEAFAGWLERVGGAKALGTELKDLDFWPDPEERPDYYVDFDETGPYVAEVGEGECAAS